MLGGGKHVPIGIKMGGGSDSRRGVTVTTNGRTRRSFAEQQEVRRNLMRMAALLCTALIVIWLVSGLQEVYVSVVHSDICQPYTSLSAIPAMLDSNDQITFRQSRTSPRVWLPQHVNSNGEPVAPLTSISKNNNDNTVAIDLFTIISNTHKCIEKRSSATPCSFVDVYITTQSEDTGEDRDDDGLLAMYALSSGWRVTVFDGRAATASAPPPPLPSQIDKVPPPAQNDRLLLWLSASLMNAHRHINGQRATDLIDTIDLHVIACQPSATTKPAAAAVTTGVPIVPPSTTEDRYDHVAISDRIDGNSVTMMRFFCDGLFRDFATLQQVISGSERLLKDGRVPNLLLCLYPRPKRDRRSDDVASRVENEDVDTTAVAALVQLISYGYTIRRAEPLIAANHRRARDDADRAVGKRISDAADGANSDNIMIATNEDAIRVALRQYWTEAAAKDDNDSPPLYLHLHRHFSGMPMI